MKIDALTKSWIRNESDERAAANGCWFDEARAQHVIDFAQNFLCLYEGDDAGKPLIPSDWQIEATMRMFGWVRHDHDWGRTVRRFRKAGIWVPKKNKKSPTLAWWGLYLLCADGEQGQKIYSVAKDGEQAKIAHTHAVEMVRSSPALNAECTINKSTLRITHAATRSTYSIISGDNITGQEGRNGSCLVDECHVVSGELAKVIKGAGISRSEPLHIEVSTAGRNSDGYGKQRWDYGRSVESGEFTDERFLFLSYHAPQDLSDEELAADPEKFGRMANPAWGHTVKPGEFLDDYHASKNSLTDLTTFKTYRLNIWAQASNPWLRQEHWKQCAKPFSAADLQGEPCFLGLDLSKTSDTTAAVLAFPGDDEFRVLPYFWLPEDEAKSKNHLAPYLDWAKTGFIELTPGNVVDYSYIERRIIDINSRFNLQGIVFDRVYAEELTQRLEENHGIPRMAFAQTWSNFASPTADFERLVISGKLIHPDHPVLNWQAGHASVTTDSNQNKRPVKPKAHDYRKVDGIVAAVMALSAAISQPSTHSVYDSPGGVRVL
jgi:phage terminase large subunit-like protein